jgi:hypothetical protein
MVDSQVAKWAIYVLKDSDLMKNRYVQCRWLASVYCFTQLDTITESVLLIQLISPFQGGGKPLKNFIT